MHPVEKGVALNVSEYAKRELTRHRELSRFFNNRRWGHRVAFMLPLNLSEVYVMLVALKKFELACGEGDPHAMLAARLANMAYGELSGYAKKKLADRLSEAGYVFRPEGPAFRDDMHGSSEWVKFEKSGVRMAVELDEGQSLVGVIVGVGRRRGDKPGDRRPRLTLRLDDGSEISVPWSQVVSIEKAEG